MKLSKFTNSVKTKLNLYGQLSDLQEGRDDALQHGRRGVL